MFFSDYFQQIPLLAKMTTYATNAKSSDWRAVNEVEQNKDGLLVTLVTSGTTCMYSEFFLTKKVFVCKWPKCLSLFFGATWIVFLISFFLGGGFVKTTDFTFFLHTMTGIFWWQIIMIHSVNQSLEKTFWNASSKELKNNVHRHRHTYIDSVVIHYT